MSIIYKSYKPPPDPPEHLWLTIDYQKIDFRDMEHIKMIYTYIPETYLTLNSMYKIHHKNRKLYIDVANKYDLFIDDPPKIMKKERRKLQYCPVLTENMKREVSEWRKKRE